MTPAVTLSTQVVYGSIPAGALHKEGEQVWPALAPWSPADLAGLVIWFDASQLGLADGAGVNPWPNLGSGPAGTIVKTSGYPDDPKVRTNVLNGLPVVRFSQTQGRVRATPTGIYLEWTLLYVGRIVGPFAGRVVSGTYPPANLVVGFWNGNKDAMYDNGFANNTYGPVVMGEWKLYGGDGTAGRSRLFSNGVELGYTPTAAGWNESFNLSGYGATGHEETCDCEVAEVVLYDRKLPDADRQLVEAYLREKWLP